MRWPRTRADYNRACGTCGGKLVCWPAQNRPGNRHPQATPGLIKVEYTEPGEEALDWVGVFPEGSGEIGSFGQTEEIDRGVAEGGQVMSASGKTDPAAVLSPMRIANPMLAIFDAPMATPQSEQLHRTCPIGCKTGNGVLDLARGVATSGASCVPVATLERGPATGGREAAQYACSPPVVVASGVRVLCRSCWPG